MKINDFYDKSPDGKNLRIQKTASGVTELISSQTIIKLNIEADELKNKLELSEQLLEKETQIHLKEKEGFSIAKKTAKESNEQLVKTTEQHSLLVLDVKTYQETMTKQNTVIKELKDRVSSLTPIENTYKEFQAKYLENVEELRTATTKITVLYSIKDTLEEQVRELSGYKKATKKELEHLKTEYNSMSDVFSTLEQTILGLKEDLVELGRELQRWKNGYTSLEQENNNLVSIKTNLTNWLEDIKGEALGLPKKGTFQERELQKAKTTIKTQLLLALTTGSFSEMGEVLEDLLDTNTHLRTINKKQLVELGRPKYTSISSIERTEGFKLPRNLIAPKNALGHGKPTLLKVRTS